MSATVATIVWIVGFVLLTVTVTGLSGRVNWSAPIALVVVGAGTSFVPGVPDITIDPEAILYGVLPPLLFAAAIQTSFRDVRARRDSILALSVGLVVFTAFVAGVATWLLVPGLGLAAAVAFGAVIAPTDAVAVSSVTGSTSLPRRLVTILQGESLLNDASALVTLNAAIAATVTVLNPGLVVGEFALEIVVGVGVGLLVGWLVSLVRRQLRAPVLDTSLSLITPYLAFIAAQLLFGSGVLAVVIAGLLLGYRSPTVQSAEARVAERINWRTIEYLLENAVFLFIGLSLRHIVVAAWDHGPGLWGTIAACLGILLSLVVARVVWVFALTLVYRHGPRFIRARSWSWRNAAGVSAAGIRGVVTLVAAFLLPDIPQRPFLQFLAFVVVLGTLLEGLALAPILRMLKLPPPNIAQELAERGNLLAEVRSAGEAELDRVVAENDPDEVVDHLRRVAQFHGAVDAMPVEPEVEHPTTAYRRLRMAMIQAERAAVLDARRENRYQEPAVLAVLASIDAEETALRMGEK
ncbi:Na+/H+ antiporter [Pseudolysinimonas kribbensis]|uniref:Na+/H+ antiporter n=1 Tax=Pseudolysinimonas kribbensis TaxID=433641 RepID=A0ABQ6K7K2_9MICO|nr:cation:proton antiporter [Pseudolysinimonas kribbensis]GMA96374.1 Na+/H+ antiporter [Pseudolysinimonas kribbensis]